MCVDYCIGLIPAWIELILFKVGLKKILPTRTDGDTDSTEGVSQVYALGEPAEVLQLLNWHKYNGCISAIGAFARSPYYYLVFNYNL